MRKIKKECNLTIIGILFIVIFFSEGFAYSDYNRNRACLRAPLLTNIGRKDKVEERVASWVKENCQSLREQGVEVTPEAEYFLNALFRDRDVLKACALLLNHCILKKPVLRVLQKFADTTSGMVEVEGIAESALAVVSDPERADVYFKEHYLDEELTLTDTFSASLFRPTKELSMSSEELLSHARENFFLAVVGADDLSKIISHSSEPMILGRRLQSSDGAEYLCKFYYSPDENKLSGLLFVEGARVLVQEIDLRSKTLTRLEGTFEKGEATFDLRDVEVSKACHAVGCIRNVCSLADLDFVINIDPTPSYRFLRESLKDPGMGQLCVRDHQTASDGSRVSSLLFPLIFNNPFFKGCLNLQELVMSDNGIFEPHIGQSLFVGFATQDEEILGMSDEHILAEYIRLASMIQRVREYLTPIVPYQHGEAVYIMLWDASIDDYRVPIATAQQIIGATSITIKKGYMGYLLRKGHIEVNNRTLLREMSHHVSHLVRKMDEQLEIQFTSGPGLYVGWNEIIDRIFDLFEQAGSMPPHQPWRNLFEYASPYDSGHELIENLVGNLAGNLREADPSSYEEHDGLLDTGMPLHPSRIYDMEVPLPDSFVATARRLIHITPRPVPGAWVYGMMAFREEVGQALIETASKIGVWRTTVHSLSTTQQLEVMMKYGWSEFEGVDVPAEKQKEFLEYKKVVMDEIRRFKGEAMKGILEEQSLSGFALGLKAKFPDQIKTIDKWSAIYGEGSQLAPNTSLVSDRITQLVQTVSDSLSKDLGLKYLELLECKEQTRKIMTDYYSLYACASAEYKIPLSKRDDYDTIISETSTRLAAEMKRSPLAYVDREGNREPTMLAWLEKPDVLEKIVTGKIIAVDGTPQLREGMLKSVAIGNRAVNNTL